MSRGATPGAGLTLSLCALAILGLAACTPTVPAGETGSSGATSSEFLTCPSKPGRQYRPGFEETACKD
jgi:hypothetical protein